MNFSHFIQNTKFLIITHGLIATFFFLIKVFFIQLIKNKKFYTFCTWDELIKKKRSDKVFILGSGYSLNKIKNSEWKYISNHDVVGFNSTIMQKWVRVDYHLIRGWAEGSNIYSNLEKIGKDLVSFVDNNKNYKETIFLLQNDFYGLISHILLNKKILKKNSKIFSYYTLNSKFPKKHKKLNLLSHLSGTLSDVTHFTLNMGWKEVVLVGVDLYDTRYFYLEEDQTFSVDKVTGHKSVSKFTDHGKRFDDEHSTIRNGVIEEFRVWNKLFNENNSKLMVYNKKSLLNKVLKIYE